MEYVVDLQGFKKPINEFVLKEFSAISLTDSTPLTLSFEAPYMWNDLPVKYKCTNAWLTRNFHGLPWNFGSVPYNAATGIIQSILHNARTIYVKGSEKREWLANFLLEGSERIINLEMLDCPSLQELRKQIDSICPHHENLLKFNCAHRNVQLLKNWILKPND